MKELVKRLSREGLPDVHGHLQGGTLRKELNRRIGEATNYGRPPGQSQETQPEVGSGTQR